MKEIFPGLFSRSEWPSFLPSGGLFVFQSTIIERVDTMLLTRSFGPAKRVFFAVSIEMFFSDRRERHNHIV